MSSLLHTPIFKESNIIVKLTLDFIKKIYSLYEIKIQTDDKCPSIFLTKIMEIYNGNDGESLVSELLNYYYDNSIENLNVTDILLNNTNTVEAFNGFCNFFYSK